MSNSVSLFGLFMFKTLLISVKFPSKGETSIYLHI